MHRRSPHVSDSAVVNQSPTTCHFRIGVHPLPKARQPARPKTPSCAAAIVADADLECQSHTRGMPLCPRTELPRTFRDRIARMKRVIAVAVVLSGSATGLAQPEVDVAAALKTVTPDLDQRLARFKPVTHAVQRGGAERARARDGRPAGHRAAASSRASTGARAIRTHSRSTTRSRPTRRRSRRTCGTTCSSTAAASIWSTSNKPFVGTAPMPPGRALYPAGLTRAEIEAYVARNPSRKQAIYNPYTVVTRPGQATDLAGEWYHSRVRRVHAAGRRGAAQGRRPVRRSGVRRSSCACAPTRMLTDDYYNSDIAWLDLKDPKFDIIFAPYETYLDDLLGVKTSYGASILIRNDAESRKLAVYQKWIPDIQDALPLAADGSAVGARARDADGSDGRAVPRRRSAPRLPGGRRQPAERSAHPPGEGHQEDLLQELHGRARQRRHPAAGRARDGRRRRRARRRPRAIWRPR